MAKTARHQELKNKYTKRTTVLPYSTRVSPKQSTVSFDTKNRPPEISTIMNSSNTSALAVSSPPTSDKYLEGLEKLYRQKGKKRDLKMHFRNG